MLGRVTSYPPPPGQGNGPMYPPPPGGVPPWGGQGPVPADNRATWALVLAIGSIVLACCCGLLSVAGGIAAVILARQVRRQAEQYGPRADTSTAVAAFWVGVAAIALGAVSTLSTVVSVLLELSF